MTKKTYLIIAVVLAIIVAGFVWWTGKETSNVPDTVAPVDTTDAINAELDAIDIGNLDAEFTDVDETIKGL